MAAMQPSVPGEEDNIYDELYELPERNMGAAGNIAGRKSEVPSYYVDGDGI